MQFKDHARSLKRRLVEVRKALLVGPFKHEKAQKYELKSATATMKEYFEQLYQKYETKKKNGEIYHTSDNQFFAKDEVLWQKFLEDTKGKTALEIGSGPFGYLVFTDWVKARHVIDPLINSYREVQLKHFNRTFFTDAIHTYSYPAETLVSELVNTIDGFIVCRNCIDHTEDPWTILYNICQYAKPGSYLLFWADIWHIGGSIDEGHHSVTKNKDVIEAFLTGQGYRILKTHDGISTHGNTIDYGCLAVKV